MVTALLVDKESQNRPRPASGCVCGNERGCVCSIGASMIVMERARTDPGEYGGVVTTSGGVSKGCTIT